MLRKALVAKGHKVSVNDFILRAAGRALVEVPGGTCLLLLRLESVRVADVALSDLAQ